MKSDRQRQPIMLADGWLTHPILAQKANALPLIMLAQKELLHAISFPCLH